jgi:uncharacterized OB-fold protein
MSRPTRYCARCGEYIAERHIFSPTTRTLKLKLVHVSETGAVIHRNHAPTEDLR